LARMTVVLPDTTAGASLEIRPSRALSPGAAIPTTPVGSGIVKLKYGPATGLVAPRSWPILSAHPAYQTQRSIEASTPLGGSFAPASASSDSNWDRRPSINSATRYRIWPRLYAVLPAHSGWAARAAPAARGPARSAPAPARADGRRGRTPRTSAPTRCEGTRRR